MSQCEPQSAQPDAVEAPERPREQGDRELGRERLTAQHERGGGEQRRGSGCVAEGRARGVAGCRHVGEREPALEGGHVGAGAHDDGHGRPRHAAEEVPLAQEPGESLALGRVRRRLDAEHRRERFGIACVGPGAGFGQGADRCAGMGIGLGAGSCTCERRPPMRAAEGGADVVRHRAHELPDGGPAPMHLDEVDASHRRTVEHGGERAEQLGSAASEPVARDVGIAERDDRHPTRRECPEQRGGRLRGLLGVVDDEETEPAERAERCGCRGVDRASPHDRRGEGAQLGGVELRGPNLLLHLGVLGEEGRRGHPLGPAGAFAETRQCACVHAVLDRAHHDVAHLGPEAAQHPHLGRERVGPSGPETVADAALDELCDDLVVLGAGEQGHLPTGVRADELERHGGRRAGDRAARGDTEPHRELVAQRGGRGPRGGQHEHLVGGEAEACDAVGHEFDDEPRLAGARCPEHRRVLAVDEGRDGVQEGRGAGHALNGNGFRRQ